ncbi:hypothetical protein UMNK88_900 [Escherichia coli UMNK88]|nr:hypothetical protein UMNK88_900 [Escherichia coli UMNK88]
MLLHRPKFQGNKAFLNHFSLPVSNASRGSLFNLADDKNQFYRPQRSLV